MEEQLEEFSSFFRIHHSYIVNLNEANKYIRGDGGYLVMNNSTTINVPRSRKALLLKKFNTGGESYSFFNLCLCSVYTKK
ncbi:MAG TPA: LytTR family DNA-binding domain-containing protein [Chitinophagaceae bacterium]